MKISQFPSTMNLTKKFASFAFGISLISLLIIFLKRTDRLSTLLTLDFADFVVSVVLLLVCFILNGIQTRIALKSTCMIKISALDTIVLPITQNFWGHVIPFQGSLVYSATFLKAKYRADISKSLSIGLFITLCSLVVGALVGVFHSIWYKQAWIPLYALLLLLPVWMFLFNWFFRRLKPKRKLLLLAQKIVVQVLNSMLEMTSMPGLVASVIILDSFFVITYAGWSYYLSEILAQNIPFLVHILVAYLLKLSFIVKVTPGNMGLVQIFTGGVFALYGFPAEAGMLISTLQLGLIVVLFFPLAIVISLFQWKYIRSLFWKT
jgi:hypothetical protein